MPLARSLRRSPSRRVSRGLPGIRRGDPGAGGSGRSSGRPDPDRGPGVDRGREAAVGGGRRRARRPHRLRGRRQGRVGVSRAEDRGPGARRPARAPRASTTPTSTSCRGRSRSSAWTSSKRGLSRPCRRASRPSRTRTRRAPGSSAAAGSTGRSREASPHARSSTPWSPTARPTWSATTATADGRTRRRSPLPGSRRPRRIPRTA